MPFRKQKNRQTVTSPINTQSEVLSFIIIMYNKSIRHERDCYLKENKWDGTGQNEIDH
jgi:hypothetical protein